MYQAVRVRLLGRCADHVRTTHGDALDVGDIREPVRTLARGSVRCPRRPGPAVEPDAVAGRPRERARPHRRGGRRADRLADAGPLRRLHRRAARGRRLAHHHRPLPDEPAPEGQVVLDDENARLWDCLGRLPDRCQRLLRIVAAEARPDYSAIATELDMPVGSIGPTRGRCLDKLRRELAVAGGF